MTALDVAERARRRDVRRRAIAAVDVLGWPPLLLRVACLCAILGHAWGPVRWF